MPVVQLMGHSGCLNALDWAPHSSCHIATAGDDKQAFIWDLRPMPKEIEGLLGSLFFPIHLTSCTHRSPAGIQR